MMRVLLVTVGVLVVLYLLYVGYFYVAQRTILFPVRFTQDFAVGPPPDPDLERIWLAVGDAQVEAWFLPAGGAGAAQGPQPAMMIAHGNGEVIDLWPEAVEALRAAGVHVLLVEYPGYGRSTGAPTEASITQAFVQAYDHLVARPEVDAERVVLFGRSVGSGAVVALAAQRPSAAMVLVSPFTSVRDLARRQGLPGFLARDPFDNVAVLRGYDRPVLIFHGLQDTIIPAEQGRALAAIAPQAEFVSLPCGHNDCIPHWPLFWAQVMNFLEEHDVVMTAEDGAQMYTEEQD